MNVAQLTKLNSMAEALGDHADTIEKQFPWEANNLRNMARDIREMLQQNQVQ